MTSFTIIASTCAECTAAMRCVVVACPQCEQVRYLDDWEVRNDPDDSRATYAICPAHGCIVESYRSTGENRFICRVVAEAIAREEKQAEAAKGKRKPRKAKAS